MKPWQQYILGATLLAITLTPILYRTIIPEYRIVVSGDGRWLGKVEYRNLGEETQKLVSGIGDKETVVHGELQQIFLQSWFAGPEEATSIKVEIYINDVLVYEKSAFTHSLSREDLKDILRLQGF